MKNKKLISLVAALAMIFSMFSAFTVVNAEATKGMKVAGTLSKDGTEITVVVSAVGIEKNLASAGIAFAVPEGVTADAVTVEKGIPFGKTSITSKGILKLAYLDTEGDGAAIPADKVLATIKIKLAAPLAADYAVNLDDAASIQEKGEAELTVADGNMLAENTTVGKWQDPNKKPDTVPRPGENTDPDDTPDVPQPVPPVGKGMALEASLDKDNAVLTVVVKAANIEKNLASAGIAFAVPEGVTADAVTVEKGIPFGKTSITSKGILKLAYLDTEGDGAAIPADKVLATIKITLPAVATAPVVVKLDDAASIQEKGEAELTVADGMTATTAVATLNSGSTVKPTTYALKNYVGNGYAEAIAAVPSGETVYMTVNVTNASGAEAEYGTDYDAEYPAGVKLTKKQFENLIHGYTDADMVDVINGLKINVYNSANASKIKTTLNATNQESQLVNPVDTNFVTGPAPAAKHPKLTVTSTKSTANPGDKVTVTTKLTNPGTDGKLTVKTTSDSLDVIARSGIKVVAKDGTEKSSLDAGVETEIDVTDSLVFTAQIKGSVVLTYNYTCTNNLGEADQIDKAITKTIKIEEKKTPTPGGSSSSDDDDTSGMGPIAGGNLNPGDGTTGVFTDIADVPWALEAITVLASKGIINGRDANTFDPNANITRAEYCQILIGAINKTQEAADSSFDDVASDAWYYHAVSVASKYGIVSGYGDGNFGPSDLITRQDMALMTMKAAQVMNKDLTAKRTLTFADADQVSDYASEAVSTLANAGIINGVSDTEFAPKANATRAQAAVILYQTFVKAN